jgi:hypothetical protein
MVGDDVTECKLGHSLREYFPGRSIPRERPSHHHPHPHHRAHNPLALNSQRSYMVELQSFTTKVKTVTVLRAVSCDAV